MATTKIYKPIALHNTLSMGLQEPPVWPIPAGQLKDVIHSMKMSIIKAKLMHFLTDSEANIKSK